MDEDSSDEPFLRTIGATGPCHGDDCPPIGRRVVDRRRSEREVTMMPGGHVTAERISAYLDGGLTSGERDAFEAHLVSCPECRQDLAEASELARSDRGLSWKVAVPLAAAAIALIWIGAPGPGLSPDAVRSAPGAIAETPVTTVAPEDGASATADSLVFEWRPVSPDALYRFTLTDAEGDVLFTVDQGDTSLVLPRSVGLARGSEYFWVVDALLDGARATTSGFRRFIVE